MSRYLAALSLGLGLTLSAGCTPTTPPAGNAPPQNTTPADSGSKGGVHVNAPGVNVDVEKKDAGDKKRDVNVDVHPRQP